jgi:membrane protein YqaA with SNARE-associated domain
MSEDSLHPASSSENIPVERAAPSPSGPLGWVRRLYDWVLHWADTPYGYSALIGLSLIEAIFFPIPPDILLIALVLGARSQWFKFALGCTIASVLGGLIGYGLGYGVWASLADVFYQYVPGFSPEKFNRISALYDEYGFWVVFTAGFTPIPFKVITVTAGVCQINLAIFIFASALSRGARFFLVSWLLHRYGDPVKTFIDRRFNQLTLLFMALLIGGFMLLKFVAHEAPPPDPAPQGDEALVKP